MAIRYLEEEPKIRYLEEPSKEPFIPFLSPKELKKPLEFGVTAPITTTLPLPKLGEPKVKPPTFWEAGVGEIAPEFALEVGLMVTPLPKLGVIKPVAKFIGKVAKPIIKPIEKAVEPIVKPAVEWAEERIIQPIIQILKRPLLKPGVAPEIQTITTSKLPVPDYSKDIEIITNALKEAKPLRREQQKLYREALAKKFEAAKKVEITGEKGFYAELAKFKGELPKVRFEPIREKVAQESIDNLFKAVQHSPALTYDETIAARKGLAKLFGEYGGNIPQPKELELLSKVFPDDFIKTAMDKLPLLTRLKNLGIEVANVPRSVMASFDLSFGLRQGIFVAARHPILFWKNFAKQFAEFGSEKVYRASMENIVQNPYYKLARESKLSFTELGKIAGIREERFMSSLAERVPRWIPGFGQISGLIRASARAYTGFANKLRMDIFENMAKNATKIGRNLKDNPELAKEVANFVNTATGRGALPEALKDSATILNAAFFSPRLMASRINLLNPITYIKADPLVRKEALSSLIAFGSSSMALLGLAKLGGAEVGIDPRSADFGKIKIDDTRIDIGGGFQQYLRLAGQLVSGQIVSSTTGKVIELGEGYKPLTRADIIQRFVEYKEAPVLSFAVNLLRGRTAFGERVDIPAEVGQRFVPMVIADLYDIAKDDPNLLPLVPLGVFGMGLQTYKALTPKEKAERKVKELKRKLGLK